MSSPEVSGRRMVAIGLSSALGVVGLGGIAAVGNHEQAPTVEVAYGWPPVKQGSESVCVDQNTGAWSLSGSISADAPRGNVDVKILDAWANPSVSVETTAGKIATIRAVFPGDVEQGSIGGEADYPSAPGEPYSRNDLFSFDGSKPDGCEPEDTTLPPTTTEPVETTQPPVDTTLPPTTTEPVETTQPPVDTTLPPTTSTTSTVPPRTPSTSSTTSVAPPKKEEGPITR